MPQQTNEAPNAEQTTATNAASTDTTTEDTERRIQKAREEEKRRLYAQIEQEKAERLALEKKLAEREKAEKEQKLAQLPPDQQVAARLSELEQRLAAERGEALQREATLQNHLRALGLVAYRERALQEVPREIHDFVHGNSEEEIDVAIDRAKSLYGSLEQRLRAKLAPAQPAPQAMAVPMASPPMNPAFVAQPQYPVAGFPTATNPLPVAEGLAETDLTTMTSEQAVRNGKYGGEMRDRILAQLRGQAGAYQPTNPGATPRHLSGVSYQQMPNGVMQPMGTPMQAPMPTQMVQSPSPVGMPAPMPTMAAGDPRAEALAAIQRTHAGQNPVMGAQQGAHGALAAAQAYAQQHGIANPAEAFAARFSQG